MFHLTMSARKCQETSGGVFLVRIYDCIHYCSTQVHHIIMLSLAKVIRVGKIIVLRPVSQSVFFCSNQNNRGYKFQLRL